MAHTRPLHDAHPNLADKLPHLPLASLPTPVVEVGSERCRIFVKRDDLTSAAYGGNKVRKLEYLLGQARRHGCEQVATFGAAGSNHATATAVHATAAGLKCVNFLSRQRRTPFIAANLLRQLDVGAQIVYVDGDRARRQQTAHDTLKKSACKTWLIPMGGSSCTGTIGYVNAAYELAEQIRARVLPAPDVIYIPLGTMGTAVGLCIGLRAVGIDAPLVAVRVVHETIGSERLAKRLMARTSGVLHRLDASFPTLSFEAAHFRLRHEQFGRGYAHATDAALDALAHARENWGLSLETTYSAKTVAALLGDRRAGRLDGATVLYWNTYSSVPKPPTVRAQAADRAPRELRDYL